LNDDFDEEYSEILYKFSASKDSKELFRVTGKNLFLPKLRLFREIVSNHAAWCKLYLGTATEVDLPLNFICNDFYFN